MILTDTASRAISELGCVGDGDEVAGGDGISDFDVDHFELIG